MAARALLAPGSRVYRDNLDENGAAIRMRAASRKIRNNCAEALARSSHGAALWCPCVNRDWAGQVDRSRHVRNAPKATVGGQSVVRRDGPTTVIGDTAGT